MKVKTNIAASWKAYMDSVSNYNKQIEDASKDPYLSDAGKKAKIGDLQSLQRSAVTSVIKQMKVASDTARDTLNKQYASRGTYTAPGMTPAEYQAALTNTLSLVKQTADVISEAEYQSLVEPFKNDPLAVKTLNALLEPRVGGDQWNRQWFTLPVPQNPAESFGELSADLDRLLKVEDGSTIFMDDLTGGAMFLQGAIGIRINDLPEVE